MASLSDKLTEADIDIALEGMKRSSDGLRQAYDNVLSRIENNPLGIRQLAQKVLLWVVHAKRLLRPDELRHALAISPESHALDAKRLHSVDDILTCCAGLVVLDRTSNYVRLVHHTTQEYFHFFGWNFFGGREETTCLASHCLTYLTYNTPADHLDHGLDIISNLSRDLPFLSYAALHWADHFRDQEPNQHVTLQFLNDLHKTTRSFQVLWSIRRMQWMFPGHKFPKAVHGIHLVCYLGLTSLVAQLLKSVPADMIAGEGRRPLSYAAEQGHLEAARVLIEHGAVLDVCDSQGYPALSYAAAYGHASLVELLIKHGASLSSEQPYVPAPLFLAISSNHEQATKVLLEHGAGTIVKGTLGELQVCNVSLLDAAFHGRVLLAEFLLNNGAEPEFKDGEGRTALSYAAHYGHIAFVELLIDRGAQIDLGNRYSRTPLSYAAENGHEAIIHVLLGYGAVPDGNYPACRQTPLEYAIKAGHQSVAQLLIQAGANIHAENRDGHTPLLQAASSGLDCIIELLISKGASVSHIDIWGLGALSY
ncbi:ankyrin repeat-containing domain protein [Aspergillus keveii]|uniref:Ankyrin repeat-containing domain protein n=1 Tax=Aspergillus keveii TaxID=714993 RepID=A0ABR4FM20_9EURO